MSTRLRLAFVLLLLLSAFVRAAATMPEGGSPVLPNNSIGSLKQKTTNAIGVLEKVRLSDADSMKNGLHEAVRCTVTGQPKQIWDIQFQFGTTRLVQKNEVLLARFRARSVKTDDDADNTAVIRPLFEMAGPPNDKSLSLDLEITPQWKEYFLPFKSLNTYAPGQASAGFHLGFQPQTVEIAGFELYGYGVGYDMSKLPRTSAGYRGQEPDAAWRGEAEKRIEQIRKGDIEVTVVDAKGQPIAGAEVKIDMKRHAFGFGSAVTARHLLGESRDADRYREIVEKNFSRVVFENDLKWNNWENEKNREATLKAAKWLRDRNIEIRGHCLVWPSWQHTPRDLQGLASDEDALRKRIDEHVIHEASTMKGLLVDWDVINEPYTNNDVMKVLGDGEMVRWFKLAREQDPNVNLYLNDYSILTGSGLDKSHQDHFEKTLKFLKDNGAPITGLGMQSHFGGAATPPERMLEILDRFAELGLDISITEHDIASTDEAFQADFTRDFLMTTFGHPSVVAVIGWGFWERAHWKPSAAYYRADWSVTPAGQVWLDLVTKKWWTNFTGKTGTDGTVKTRGFLGDYVVTVKKGNKGAMLDVKVVKEGNQVKIIVL